jgi:hypothetical protein
LGDALSSFDLVGPKRACGQGYGHRGGGYPEANAFNHLDQLP